MSNFDAHCQSPAWGCLRAKHSVVRAFLGTWMCIFDKAGASDMLSAWTELGACLRAHAQSGVSH